MTTTTEPEQSPLRPAVAWSGVLDFDDDQGEENDRTCPHCGGDGMSDDITRCEHCDGEGKEWWL